MQDKIILTGFMATGKSTVGKLIARRLGWPLTDCDREIALRAGKSVDAIFAEDGETGFRALEREIVAKVASEQKPCVIATGGGALVDDDNFEALSKAGVIVCLSARPEVVAGRVKRSAHPRPKLQRSGKPLDEAIAELMAARQETYARAQITVDTSDLSAEEAADRVLEALASQGRPRCEPSA